MKFFKWIGKFFSFGAKYRKEEEKYHKESKKSGPVGHLIYLILTSIIPLLCLWGAYALPWTGEEYMWVLKVLCIIGSLMIFTTPTELFILGIVALRHRIRMRIENKVENVVVEGLAEAISGQEMTEEDRKHMEERKARGTQDKMDLVIGILALVMSVVVVIAFVTMFFCFSVGWVRRLS